METINGIEIKISDLKKEADGTFTLFRQFQDLLKKNNLSAEIIKNSLLDKYESLLVEKNDELSGVTGDKKELIGKIPDAYITTQQMFLTD